MAQQSKVGTFATKIHKHGDVTYVTYHSTDVVIFDQDYIKLDTGGWFSQTTKTRMNQASRQFHLGYHVFQQNYQWYVDTPASGRLEFKGNTISFPVS
jgi:hypothetical protein